MNSRLGDLPSQEGFTRPIRPNNLTSAPIPTVNFHIVASCNMNCLFCYAQFIDVSRETKIRRHGLDYAKAAAIISELASFGFKKINFAGGEPTLRADLPKLLKHSKSCGLTTSIVTNGSLLSRSWIIENAPHLDQLAISIDSANPKTRIAMGRAVGGTRPLENEVLLAHAGLLREHGVKLKLNSVVTALNARESMSDFVRAFRPDRWKVFQALRIDGQNGEDFDTIACDDASFKHFVAHHQSALMDSDIKIFPEDNAAMTSSYIMIDPSGRFFDNEKGHHSYSQPILEGGIATAISQIKIDVDRFIKRGGQSGL